VAIGNSAGLSGQGINAVAIGINAGNSDQQTNSVAIGNGAGQNNLQENSIAIGNLACQNSSVPNSICLNASGTFLNTSQAGLFVRPIRQVPLGGVPTNVLYFEPTTFEILRG
jgi:hypothetical protein